MKCASARFLLKRVEIARQVAQNSGEEAGREGGRNLNREIAFFDDVDVECQSIGMLHISHRDDNKHRGTLFFPGVSRGFT